MYVCLYFKLEWNFKGPKRAFWVPQNAGVLKLYPVKLKRYDVLAGYS